MSLEALNSNTLGVGLGLDRPGRLPVRSLVVVVVVVVVDVFLDASDCSSKELILKSETDLNFELQVSAVTIDRCC